MIHVMSFDKIFDLTAGVYFCFYNSACAPLNAGYTFSVRGTRLNVLVLLNLALAGKSPTCILREGTHPVTRAIDVSHAACKAEF